jgi:hypothetical protein
MDPGIGVNGLLVWKPLAMQGFLQRFEHVVGCGRCMQRAGGVGVPPVWWTGRVAKSVEIPERRDRAGFTCRGSGRDVKEGSFERLMQGFPAIHLSHLDLV